MSEDATGTEQFTIRPRVSTIELFKSIQDAVYPDWTNKKHRGNELAARILDAVAKILKDGNSAPQLAPLIAETWSKFHAKPPPDDLREQVRRIVQELEQEKKSRKKAA